MPSSNTCAVVIARPGLAQALRERFALDGSVVIFDDSNIDRALDVITERAPTVVAFDREVVSMRRGAALIDRLKTSPRLAASSLRVLSHDGADMPVLLKRPAMTSADVGIATASQPLELVDSRRARRVLIREGLEVFVNGDSTSLVNLSLFGAQVLSSVALLPNRLVRVALREEWASRFSAAIAWSVFERPRTGAEPVYRAGLEFRDADPCMMQEYCVQYRANA